MQNKMKAFVNKYIYIKMSFASTIYYIIVYGYVTEYCSLMCWQFFLYSSACIVKTATYCILHSSLRACKLLVFVYFEVLVPIVACSNDYCTVLATSEFTPDAYYFDANYLRQIICGRYNCCWTIHHTRT